MFDDLLPHYNRELVFLRKLAAEFAEAHPRIAANLRLSGDGTEDPHVGRLIEAVALLNARISHKLDDEFSEVTDALLGVLYPHYLAPTPSMGIVRMTAQDDLGGRYEIPRGTEIDVQATQKDTCRYRTTAPVTLWPFSLTGAALSPAPFSAPFHPRVEGAASVLRLSFQTPDDDISIAALKPDRVRLFLNGPPQVVFPLYELLLNNTIAVGVAASPDDARARFLEPDAIAPVGLRQDEAMLSGDPRSHRGYRLLSEYFSFAEKFLFVDIGELHEGLHDGIGRTLELFVYLDRAHSDLQRQIGPSTFVQGCAPVVNLFRQTAEPVRLSQDRYEYKIVPDARRAESVEIYKVEEVRAVDQNGSSREFLPFYALEHGNREVSGYWHTSRRREAGASDGRALYLSLVDEHFDPEVPADSVLHVMTTCTNGELPAAIPYGGGQPRLGFVRGFPGVQDLRAMTAFTPTRAPRLGDTNRWRLVSHLTLNHLSLEGGESTRALKEILKLYDVADSPETRAIIDGIQKVSAAPGIGRYPAGPGAPPWASGVCRGIDVAVEFDPSKFSGNGMFLFAVILNEFFGLYSTINAFTRLTARVRGQTGILRQWAPRAGERPLL